LRDHYDALRDLGADVVAISADEVDLARSAAAEARLPFRIVSDPTLTIIDRFGLRHVDEPKGRSISRPAIFVLDRNRIVRYLYVGEHSRDRPAIGAILLALESID